MTTTAVLHDRCVLFHGSCSSVAELLAPNSVDAIVTDPPAGISFMAKGWDDDKGGRDAWIAWLADLFVTALRVLKPGGYALVWALPRTSHWTATALENAGYEIRDVHHHFFGSGFPKSLTSNSAAIPAGTGTALKPAVEHWILARKPLAGTVGATHAEFGTGVLNIDACRIGDEKTVTLRAGHSGDNGVYGNDTREGVFEHTAAGRWPAHLSFEHTEACGEQCVIGCPVRLLDEQSGELKSGELKSEHVIADRIGQLSKGDEKNRKFKPTPANAGGASRFFYVAKGARKEKDEGLDHLPARTGGEATGRAEGSKGTQNARAGAGRTGGARNTHPTVKSVALMRWLIRLITPPGGVVLDMFAGSGTTGVAALAEGCDFVGFELDETGEYLPIVTGRLLNALRKINGTNATPGA